MLVFSNNFWIGCIISGNYVDELNAFLASSEIQNAVISIQFAKVKIFQGILLCINYFILFSIMYKGLLFYCFRLYYSLFVFK